MWLYTVLTGVLIGLCIYLDISGLVLIFLWFILPMVKRSEYTTVWNYRFVVGMVVAFATLFIVLFVVGCIAGGYIGLNADFILLVVLSCVGCFSFWRRANTERFTPFILMAIGMGILVFGGITTDNMSGIYLLYILMAMLASVSVTELFCAEDMVKVRTEKSKETEVVEDDKIKQIEFIENPLPVPKKHVHKTMDYAFIPEESQMKYDIQVSENDDYDLKI